MRRFALSLIGFLLLAALLPVQGQSPPAVPRRLGQVNDYANLLSAVERTQLERELLAFRDSTSNEIVVATFPGVPDGQELEGFVNSLFRQWGIGLKDKDNGVLVVVFVAERKTRIEVGYGLEAVITDLLANEINQKEVNPYLREEQFLQALQNGVRALGQAARQEYNVQTQKSWLALNWLPLLVGLLLTGGVIYFFVRVIRASNRSGSSASGSDSDPYIRVVDSSDSGSSWSSSDSDIDSSSSYDGGGDSGGGGSTSDW